MSSTLSKQKLHTSRRNITIVGVGNRLLGDEGVGLHIIDNLFRIPMPSCVNIIDCGCDLLSLMSYLNNPSKLVIIDAVRAGGKPGEIYRFDYRELPTTHAEMNSAHQIRTTDAIELLKQVHPALTDSEIIVIGIEPKVMELGTDLSEEVRASLADATTLVLKEISLCAESKPIKN